MLIKLAFRNAERSIRDYAIYFFTLTFGVCIFYMFNSIFAQQAMMTMTAEQTDSVKAVMGLLNYVSVFIAVILGFLIVYANRFFIKRRKKELGIYMSLGMNRHSISVILVLETSFAALLALVTGLVLGIILSQFMSILTGKMFEADMKQFAFIFAPDAVVKSILCFSIIFFIVILCNTIMVSRLKLIDLIQGSRANERLRIQNFKLSCVLFAVSLLLLGGSYYLILTNGMFYINGIFFCGIFLGTLGTLLFFYSLSVILSALVQSNKRLYFQDLNMFVTRQIGSKINTNFASISIVCIVLLLTIGIFSIGYSMQNVLSSMLRDYAGYDCTFYDTPTQESDQNSSFAGLKAYLKESKIAASYMIYPIYNLDQKYSNLGIPIPKDAEFLSQKSVSCVTLSDYNKAMEMQGKKKLSLAEGTCAILTNYNILNEFADKLCSSKTVLTINNQRLQFAQPIIGNINNGLEKITLIVPDKNTRGLANGTVVLNLNCLNPSETTLLLQDIKKFHAVKSYEQRNYMDYTSREQIYAEAATQKAVLSFIAIYVGIVFMMICAAILSIQQLAETVDNRHRYDLLNKLGADKKLLNKALFLQILCYFLFPLLLAIVHSIFGLWAANSTLKQYGDLHIGSSIVATALFVGLLYMAYFIMTYMGSKNIIYKS
jgi:ABC-type antimicrobial peptide transport system, permease component